MIGFACKYIDTPAQITGLKARDSAKQYSTGSTTVAWLARQTASVVDEKLWSLVKQNITAVKLLVHRVSTLPKAQHMLRLSSDILPVYTHPDYAKFYTQLDVKLFLERELSKIGEFARLHNLKLSFHPGPFCVLASDNPDIVDRSILEFEYHADVARYLGYGQRFQDFKINVHIAGKRGPEAIKEALSVLSTEARNCLTIENAEQTWGLEHSLELSKDCALVLDIHHHFIKTGEYIQASDPRIAQIIDSWRGVRPTIHYSVSREDVLVDHEIDTLPDLAALLKSGFTRSKLRAHSDFFWNTAVNDWALTHHSWADIMCEAKAKNLASTELYEYSKLFPPMV